MSQEVRMPPGGAAGDAAATGGYITNDPVALVPQPRPSTASDHERTE
jgi:hypothetical protein